MKKLSLAALVFLAACGVRSSTAYYPPATPPVAYPDAPPDYLIDSGAPVSQSPLTTYAITTNGQGDWIVGWQGDAVQHHFTGDIYCPVGCDMSAVFANALPGDSIRTIANNHIGFDAVTNASVRQAMNIATNMVSGPDVPLTLDLYIDGRAAIDPYVIFPSGGRLATSELMPFNLVPDTYITADEAELAPQHKAPQGKDGKSFSLPAPLPRDGGSRTEANRQLLETWVKQQ